MEINPTSNQISPATTPAYQDPKPSDGAGFREFVGGAAQVAGQVVSNVAGAGLLGAGPLGRALNPAGGGAGSDFGSQDYASLLQEQQKLQKESAVFNSLSNISKTEHETRMAAIRNMKS